jgi:hypothetical protein
MRDELRYSGEPGPLDDAAFRLAKLARVPENTRSQFRDLIALALEEAHFGNWVISQHFPTFRASDLKRRLTSVRRAAEGLDRALGKLQGNDINSDKLAGAALAGCLLDVALDHATFETQMPYPGFLPRLTAYRHSLATLIAATAEAEKPTYPLFTQAGGPTGAGGNPAFDTFVKRLYEIATDRWKMDALPRSKRASNNLEGDADACPRDPSSPPPAQRIFP